MQPTEIKATIGRNVAFHRNRAGWSQAELAERWGKALNRRIDPTTVTRLERGKRPISVDELIVLADVFGLPWWEDLVRPPQEVAFAGILRRLDADLSQEFRIVQAAAFNYLQRQVLAQRQIRDVGELQIDGRHAVESWIARPPEEAVVLARLQLQGSLDDDERDQLARERARQLIDELVRQNLALVAPPDVASRVDGVAVTGTVNAEPDAIVFHLRGNDILDNVTPAADAD